MKIFGRKKGVDNVNIRADKVEIVKAKSQKEESIRAGSAQDNVDKSMVEIIAADNARHEVIKEAKEVNQQLKKLLVENGFTIKIYLAAGGKQTKEDKK